MLASSGSNILAVYEITAQKMVEFRTSGANSTNETAKGRPERTSGGQGGGWGQANVDACVSIQYYLSNLRD